MPRDARLLSELAVRRLFGVCTLRVLRRHFLAGDGRLAQPLSARGGEIDDYELVPRSPQCDRHHNSAAKRRPRQHFLLLRHVFASRPWCSALLVPVSRVRARLSFAIDRLVCAPPHSVVSAFQHRHVAHSHRTGQNSADRCQHDLAAAQLADAQLIIGLFRRSDKTRLIIIE